MENILLFSVKTEDYFDAGIMESIQDQLNAITSRTEIDINGSLSTITFHSTVSIQMKLGIIVSTVVDKREYLMIIFLISH